MIPAGKQDAETASQWFHDSLESKPLRSISVHSFVAISIKQTTILIEFEPNSNILVLEQCKKRQSTVQIYFDYSKERVPQWAINSIDKG